MGYGVKGMACVILLNNKKARTEHNYNGIKKR